MAKDKKKDKPNIHLQIVMQFRQHYAPAEDFETADIYWRSADVFSFIRSLGHDLIATELMFALRESGYKTEVIDGDMMWLLKEV